MAIFSLYENSNVNNQTITFDRPIKSIALEPNYIKTKSYVTGDTKVSLSFKKEKFLLFFLISK